MTIQRERARVGLILRMDYTDLAVVVGPNVRWVEYDYEDICRYAPEVLLGYRVLLTTAAQVTHGYLRGRRPVKIVCVDGPGMGDPRFVNDLGYYRAFSTRVEWYRVHRGLDPVVQRL